MSITAEPTKLEASARSAQQQEGMPKKGNPKKASH